MRLEKQWKKLLVVILVISVLLRIAAALLMGNTAIELPGTADQVSYHTLALRVLNGYGFSFGENWWPATRAGEPTAHWSFLYTFYLVAVYAIFGPNPLAARVIQAVVVGILHPILVYQLGSRFLGRKPALVAAAFTALYAYFIYYSGALMTEPFYITVILTALTLAINMTSEGITHQRKIALAVGMGLALACAVLLRQLFLLVIPFLLIWVGWRERRSPKILWLAQMALPLIIICVVILPFTIFNYQRFGQFVLLNTNAGYAFYWGNHPIYGTHFESILPAEMGTYHDLLPKELLVLDEAAMDKALLERAMQNIFEDPVRYILLSISRIPPYIQFWPSSESGLISNLSRIFSFGIFWPFMLYGLVRWGLKKGFDDFSKPGWLLLMFSVIYTGIHILTWTLIRYRLPVDAVLLLFAGFAFVDIYQLVKSSQFSRLSPGKS